MNKEEMLEKERILVLQAMIDAYLNKNGKEPSKIVFNNEQEEYGTLTKAQYQLLHFYLMDEFKVLGLNLTEEIRKLGEEIEPGVLSNFEINELNRRVDDFIMTLAILKKRKKESK